MAKKKKIVNIKPLSVARVSETYRQLLEGNSKQDILEFLITKYPEENPALIYAQAVEVMAESADKMLAESKERKLGFLQMATLNIYKKAIHISDIAGALAALKLFSTLTDANSTAKKKQSENKSGGSWDFGDLVDSEKGK